MNGVDPKANKLTQATSLVTNSLVFGFTVNNGFNYKELSDVYFQFGSSLSDTLLEGKASPGMPGAVPEPGMLSLLAGLASTALFPVIRRKISRI